MSKVGFVTMGDARSDGDVQPIGVGMLGYAFMGKAHSNAYKTLAYMTWPPPLMPAAGGDRGAQRGGGRRGGAALRVRRATRRTGRRSSPTIASSCSTTPGPNNLHAEPTIAAAEAGKHVICEKPLGRDAAESYETWQRVQAAGVKHMCAFNYRFVPAVRLARQIIESGELGEIQHFRGAYLQEWGTTEGEIWRFDKASAGSGALGDLGAHVIDLARYLVGEFAEVSALTQTFMPGRDVDDAVEAAVRFENGAVGTIEASRFCQGRKNHFTWEINGSKGSLSFDLERLNELEYSEGNAGFRTVLVSEADHPFWEYWWPQGHMIGWEHSFVHELHHLLTAIRDDSDVAPHGATLEDGYRAAEICDAMLRSAEQGAPRDPQLPLLMATVLLIGTLDTKGDELAFVAERLRVGGRRRARRRRRHRGPAARPGPGHRRGGAGRRGRRRSRVR